MFHQSFQLVSYPVDHVDHRIQRGVSECHRHRLVQHRLPRILAETPAGCPFYQLADLVIFYFGAVDTHDHRPVIIRCAFHCAA